MHPHSELNCAMTPFQPRFWDFEFLDQIVEIFCNKKRFQIMNNAQNDTFEINFRSTSSSNLYFRNEKRKNRDFEWFSIGKCIFPNDNQEPMKLRAHYCR